MRKFIFSIALLIITILSLTSISLAAESITERPNLKVNINGQIASFSDVPIIVNSRSMLPLRAILTNLGVENNDTHIIWNGIDQSVTVYKDLTKIYLQVGNLTAYVNEAPITLDAAPVNYKGRVYIPARFIAQSLNKKVAWDGYLEMVLIRELDQFNSVKDVLEKSESVMNALYKYKSTQDMLLKMTKSNKVFSFDTHASVEVDTNKKIGHILAIREQSTADNKGLKINGELFLLDNKTYLKNPQTGKLIKIDEKTEEDYKHEFVFDVVTTSEINCDGLIIESSNNTNDILLKGKMNLDGILEKYFDTEDIEEYTLSESNVEISINRESKTVNKVYLAAKGSTTSINEGAEFTVELTFFFSDFNGNFEVAVPTDFE